MSGQFCTLVVFLLLLCCRFLFCLRGKLSSELTNRVSGNKYMCVRHMSRALLSMAGSGQLASAIAAISVLPVCPPSLAQTPSPLHVRAQITVAVQLLLQLLTVAHCPIMSQSLCCSMCACANFVFSFF